MSDAGRQRSRCSDAQPSLSPTSLLKVLSFILKMSSGQNYEDQFNKILRLLSIVSSLPIIRPQHSAIPHLDLSNNGNQACGP